MRQLDNQLLANVKTIEQRLLSNREITENGCWRWTGSTYKKDIDNSYGAIGLSLDKGRKVYQVHRISYAYFNDMTMDEIANGVIAHLCDYKRCFNPEHLAYVTMQMNTADYLEKKNRTLSIE